MKAHWTENIPIQADFNTSIELPKTTALKGVVAGYFSTINYMGKNQHAIALLHPFDFGRIKSELILHKEIPISEASIEIEGIRAFRSPIMGKGKLHIYISKVSFDIPRIVQLADFNQNDRRVAQILIDWMKEKRKMGRSYEYIIHILEKRFT